MSTPEERQEAAEYLRENSIGDVVITPYTGHADPIRFPGYKLADLIDPTCHLVSTTFHSWSDGSAAFYHELSCGHICETVWGKPPSYCPECGARLV